MNKKKVLVRKCKFLSGLNAIKWCSENCTNNKPGKASIKIYHSQYLEV